MNFKTILWSLTFAFFLSAPGMLLAQEDLSGLYTGKWHNLTKSENGTVEIKIYRTDAELGSYQGYVIFRLKEDVFYTGQISLNKNTRYFSGYYSPSAYAHSGKSHYFNAQLLMTGIFDAEKPGNYYLKGEAVGSGAFEQNLILWEVQEKKRLGQ
ncbi:hypothetical protein AAG747_25905 [Rapidithrix thailandica]|uniref:Uncharacterized protein n=1 Tax=Rapidithrix thailandica TaxID=413964 RepID=A0AAW9SD99_9BACT